MEKIRLPKIDVTELEGTTFQEYAIQKVLGQGGMAIVYQAFDQRLESSVALKFLLPEHARHALVRKRFLSEARLQYKLRHPHLVRVTGLIEEGNLAGVVMDFVEGRDLSAWLKERRGFSLREIQDLFLPILSAVGYAHSQKIIHRDLKPSNILVERRGEAWHPYVMDFGIAKALDQGGSQTKTGTFLGSPDYTSPEQISGDKAIDHRTDIYALGCTLYELLVGVPPFAIKQTIQQIFFAHLAEPPPSLEPVYPKVGSQLDQLLASALHKDRNKRFPSCEAFASEVIRVFAAIQTLPPPLKGPFHTRTTEDSVSHFGATYDLPPSSSKVFVHASFVEAPPSLPPPSLRPPLDTPLPESADGPQPTGSHVGAGSSFSEADTSAPLARKPLLELLVAVLFFLLLFGGTGLWWAGVFGPQEVSPGSSHPTDGATKKAPPDSSRPTDGIALVQKAPPKPGAEQGLLPDASASAPSLRPDASPSAPSSEHSSSEHPSPESSSSESPSSESPSLSDASHPQERPSPAPPRPSSKEPSQKRPPPPSRVTLRLLSKPQAEVFEGRRKRGSTPFLLQGTEGQSFRLSLRAKGYLPMLVTIRLNKGEPPPTFLLRPLPPLRPDKPAKRIFGDVEDPPF